MKYTIDNEDGPFKPSNDDLSEDEKTKYQLTKSVVNGMASFKLGSVLDSVNTDGHAYTYCVVEESAAMSNTYYGKNENDKVTLIPGAQYAQDGQVIINQESSGYELPATGGPGTLIYYLTGLALVLSSTVFMILLRKNNEVTN